MCNKYFGSSVILIILNLNAIIALDNNYATTQISSSECYDAYGQPRVMFILQQYFYAI
jgi:hypothetical protein